MQAKGEASVWLILWSPSLEMCCLMFFCQPSTVWHMVTMMTVVAAVWIQCLPCARNSFQSNSSQPVPWPFDTIHVVVTRTIIALLFHNCNFATVMKCGVTDMQDVWYATPVDRSFDRLRTTASAPCMDSLNYLWSLWTRDTAVPFLEAGKQESLRVKCEVPKSCSYACSMGIRFQFLTISKSLYLAFRMRLTIEG